MIRPNFTVNTPRNNSHRQTSTMREIGPTSLRWITLNNSRTTHVPIVQLNGICYVINLYLLPFDILLGDVDLRQTVPNKMARGGGAGVKGQRDKTGQPVQRIGHD